ncbi:MAG: hypothetical protein ACPGWR_30520, partial [Ardenticatenaceae bacterium]
LHCALQGCVFYPRRRDPSLRSGGMRVLPLPKRSFTALWRDACSTLAEEILRCAQEGCVFYLPNEEIRSLS